MEVTDSDKHSSLLQYGYNFNPKRWRHDTQLNYSQYNTLSITTFDTNELSITIKDLYSA